MSGGILNVAIEDALACAVSEEDRHTVLRAGMLLMVEYLARDTGRTATIESLEQMERHVREAKPSTPWPD